MEARPRPPAPEREDAPLARLAVQREGRARQHVSAPETHVEQSAAARPAHQTRRRTRAGPAHRTPGRTQPRRAHRPGRRHARAAAQTRHPRRRRAAAGKTRHPRRRRAAGRMHAGPAAKPAEEAKRQVALHPLPQLPAREPAPEPRLPRRRQTFLHVLDHVHRRRPAKPRHQRPRQRVRVLDRPRRLGVGQHAGRGVRQGQRQRLLVLVVGIIEDRHLDRLRRFARRETQRAARRRVVHACLRAAVRRGVVHRHRGVGRPVQTDHEPEWYPVVFVHLRVRHRQRRGRRPGDACLKIAAEHAPVIGAHHRPARARGRAPHPHRHVTVAVGRHPQAPAPVAALAQPRHALDAPPGDRAGPARVEQVTELADEHQGLQKSDSSLPSESPLLPDERFEPLVVVHQRQRQRIQPRQGLLRAAELHFNPVVLDQHAFRQARQPPFERFRRDRHLDPRQTRLAQLGQQTSAPVLLYGLFAGGGEILR